MSTSLMKRKKESSSSSNICTTINGFTLLPIVLPSPHPSVSPATHILYLRRHEPAPVPPAITSADPSRVLFVVNVPVDATRELLRGLFASFGARAEDVTFARDERQEEASGGLPYTWDRRLCLTGGTAHVVFPEERDVDTVLKTIGKLRRRTTGGIVTWGEGVANAGTLGFQRNNPPPPDPSTTTTTRYPVLPPRFTPSANFLHILTSCYQATSPTTN